MRLASPRILPPARCRSARSPGLCGWAVLPCVLFLAACQEALPTAESDDLVRAGVAVEVTLPARDFLERVRIYGGYGRAAELGGGFIAHRFGSGDPTGDESGLEAATLLRFGRYPLFATVTDTAGTARPDSALTFLSGQIVARFDTLGSVHNGPVTIRAHALTEPWDGQSANWNHAIDTVQHRVAWSAPGGGELRPLGEVVWNPAEGDSVLIPIDSAQVAAWADTTDPARGLRLGSTTPGVRLQLQTTLLRLETLPSLNPDTIIELLAVNENATFIYDPLPPPPAAGMRVGGVPAWRTVLDLDIPATLTGPPSLCATLGCPLEIRPEHLSYAGLRLTTRAPHPAFAPSDTISIDVRPVMVPSILPKSPLGESLTGIAGVVLSPEWFAPPGGHIVEVPLTTLVGDLLSEPDASQDPVGSTIALLASFEPLSLEYASFGGLNPAGTAPGEPELRLILNFSRGGS